MRTLVAGIPLPNVDFDNFSFLSAPSFDEYPRVVVEAAAAARAVQEVVERTAPHMTYGGQAVVNGRASAYAFPLADLLEMRRRETERLLAGGGLVIVIAHPEVTVSGLISPDGQEMDWRSYAWLPAAEGFSPARHLLPGFGRHGGVLTDADHPFAPYMAELGPRIAHRAHIDETAPAIAESGRTFGRSSGGVAIAGEIAVGGGTVVLLPALADPAKDRLQVAGAVARSLERWDASRSPGRRDADVSEVSL